MPDSFYKHIPKRIITECSIEVRVSRALLLRNVRYTVLNFICFQGIEKKIFRHRKG